MPIAVSIAFVFTLLAGVPIGFSVMFASFVYVLCKGNINMFTLISQKMFVGVDNFVLLSVPLFILAGKLMNEGGVTDRLVKFAMALVGRLRGGLAHVNVVASMFFAGITGASSAELAAIGSIMIPAMEKQGFDLDFATGLTVGTSIIGPIIPPSIAMVTYSVVAGASVAKLFMAGFVPGILLGLTMMVLIYFYAIRRDYPRGEKTSLKNVVKSFWEAIWALAMPAIILGGLLFGIFSPTEAAAISVLYALIVGFFIYGGLRLKKLPQIIFESAILSGGVLFIIATVTIFAWVLSIENLPKYLAVLILGLNNKFLILMLINFILLIMGCFLEPQAIIILVTPILIPIAAQLGVDLIQLGLIVVLNVTLGVVTPPVGVCLYIASSLSGLSLERVVKGMFPFFLCCLVVLLLITYIPSLTLYLPNLLLGK